MTINDTSVFEGNVSRSARIVFLLLVGCLHMFLSLILCAQVPKSRRDAVGAKRAAQIETLLRGLYPGASVQWDPELAIRIGSENPLPIDVGDFKSNEQDDGSLTAVAVIEPGTTKQDYIEKMKKFQP